MFVKFGKCGQHFNEMRHINAEHYAQSAGFPKLAAGEDFYLLNKLAKIGKIIPLKIINQPIYIQARISNRTPFGTGPALDKIIDNSNNSQNQDILKKYEPLKTMAIDALKIIIQIFNSPPENKKIKQILDNHITHTKNPRLICHVFHQDIL